MSEYSLSHLSYARGWEHPSGWKILFLTFLLSLLMVSVMNFVVDPFGIYGTGLFQTVSLNYYQKQLFLFSEYDPPAEALIIGSSRVLSIDPELIESITGYRAFNWWGPVATPEIYYACLKIALDEYNAPVKMVIVGVEPLVFDPSRPITPQARTLRSYSKYFSDKPSFYVQLEKFSRLFTVEQAGQSLEVLRRDFFDDPSEFWITWAPNGFPSMNWDIRPDPGLNDPSFAPNIIKVWSEANYTTLSDERKMYWEKFLAACTENGIEIFVFMPPDSPSLREGLMEIGAGPISTEVSEYLSRTVDKAGGTFRDYSLLESFGGNPAWYTDDVHMSPENAELLIRNLFAGYEPNRGADED